MEVAQELGDSETVNNRCKVGNSYSLSGTRDSLSRTDMAEVAEGK